MLTSNVILCPNELLSRYLGSQWKPLFDNGNFCEGSFGGSRKKLTANDPEQCREVASLDSQCSDTIYHCSKSGGFICRCVMKGTTCRVVPDNPGGYWCTVEQYSESSASGKCSTKTVHGFCRLKYIQFICLLHKIILNLNF